MFSLPTPTSCRLLNVNPRDELHGADEVLAVDVKLSMVLPNYRLAMFDPGLLDALFLPPDLAQDLIDGVPPASTALRCPMLDPVSLDLSIVGRDVRIERATSVLILPTCKIGKFVVTAQEGGSCFITFRVQCSKVEPELVGELCGMLKRAVDVLIVESVPAGAEFDAAEAALPHDSTDSVAPGADSARDATEAFLAGLRSNPAAGTDEAAT